ncbi:MAG: phosphatase PAP2 family protein [Candidatus Kapabacteria bacterium]|nr:phosphatase PAP2 family protein [Candidatus Kapabacteria bacterium]
MTNNCNQTDDMDFQPKWMLGLIISPFILSLIYFYLGSTLTHSKMPYFQYLELTSLITAIVAGGYQLYFWTQRNSGFFKTRCLKIFIDDYIPFWPKWIWIYSFLYYVLIGGILISIDTLDKGILIIFGGLSLLVVQCICFIIFPAINPPEWREFEPNTISKRYLKFVQSYDSENNCFPSMHCSLATYISLTLHPLLGGYEWVFVFLIAISCLFTKQHQIVDVVPGILLGWSVYFIMF